MPSCSNRYISWTFYKKACFYDFVAYVQYMSIYTPIKCKLLYGIDLKIDSPHTKIDLVKISWQARTTKPRYRLQKGKYTVFVHNLTMDSLNMIMSQLDNRYKYTPIEWNRHSK